MGFHVSVCRKITQFTLCIDGGDTGLNTEDLEASTATLQSMADHLDCDTVLLREKETDDGKVAEYLVREKVVEDDFCEVR